MRILWFHFLPKMTLHKYPQGRLSVMVKLFSSLKIFYKKKTPLFFEYYIHITNMYMYVEMLPTFTDVYSMFCQTFVCQRTSLVYLKTVTQFTNFLLLEFNTCENRTETWCLGFPLINLVTFFFFFCLQHLLPRQDCEQLIRQGILEHIIR